MNDDCTLLQQGYSNNRLKLEEALAALADDDEELATVAIRQHHPTAATKCRNRRIEPAAHGTHHQDRSLYTERRVSSPGALLPLLLLALT